MGEEIKNKTVVRRGQVSITSTHGAPIIYIASEDITLAVGSVRITGVGASRQDALASLEESFGKLNDVLAAVK